MAAADQEDPAAFLAAQRERLERMLDELSARSREAKETIRNQEREVGDSVDTSAEELDAASILQLKRSELETMRQIEESLERMDEGDYEECETCGEEIGQRRLEVKPFALTCVACQEEIEREAKRRQVRPGLIDEYM